MTAEFLARVWEQLAGRAGGPLAFRFVVQPAVALLLGVRAGLRDSASGCAGAMRDIGRLWAVAFAIDAVYQGIVFGGFKPLQALVVSVLLALAPYFVVRMAVRNVVRRRRRR